jgi:outer membrane protein assembly factor BamD
LRAKLQRKDLEIANLYLKMKLYEAAIYSYKNILKDYPDSEFKEEILFSILESYYNFAYHSISLKQAERYQSALDSYNELVFQFPDTKYLKDAKNINRDVLDYVQGDSSKKKHSHKKNSDIN